MKQSERCLKSHWCLEEETGGLKMENFDQSPVRQAKMKLKC